MKQKLPFIKTRAQARAYVSKVGVCGIFSDGKVGMANLWDAVDLPHRKPGDKGWGQKVTAIWTWKDELPALYPEKIFYGKIPGGLAVLMTMEHLRSVHYPKCHVPIGECGTLAQRIYRAIRLDPMTTAALRRELDMRLRPERSKFDRALLELQVTLNIARRNSLKDKNDTWVLFSDQHLGVVRAAAEDAGAKNISPRAKKVPKKV
ncbi:hypothetical protein BH09VER1_BH09VER1_35730 [soil metagenome]